MLMDESKYTEIYGRNVLFLYKHFCDYISISVSLLRMANFQF